ncbi:hypothetical protein NN3_12920 [Nocardia neocaledoniensis NBRC 108232]|uniref:Mce-associated membrane protein n=1 Tax=Nocardia neocaledoniensis TaxID=236511 RepID=A0A317NBQ3_9NOCA|nr:hypothetical protein [Nocardia neocaledoniensis]PWV71048.1 Mce-associated membrane protein [Nocardia neocaledoniensis]GEM30285.1 hypothetical protein NN3_12920 [Nocardia neocaledoniensis NBRC 108232]
MTAQTLPAPSPTDEEPAERRPARRQLTLPVSTLLTGALAVFGILAGVCFAVLWVNARADLNSLQRDAADDLRAERVATDYAVGASQVDYRDVDSWVGRLKAGTSTTLAAKFDATAPKLKDILVPMQWTSTGSASSAKVASRSAEVFLVDVYVEVDSTSAQTTEKTRTTVHYAVTVDAGSGWQVVDVGGAGGALPLK